MEIIIMIFYEDWNDLILDWLENILNVSLFILTTFAAINNHKDQIQSISWRDNGQVFVTSCKDKRLRIIDPRTSSVVQVYYTNGYQYYIYDFEDDLPERVSQYRYLYLCLKTFLSFWTKCYSR